MEKFPHPQHPDIIAAVGAMRVAAETIAWERVIRQEERSGDPVDQRTRNLIAIEQIQRMAMLAAEPFADAVARIDSLRPQPPIFMSVDQARALSPSVVAAMVASLPTEDELRGCFVAKDT